MSNPFRGNDLIAGPVVPQTPSVSRETSPNPFRGNEPVDAGVDRTRRLEASTNRARDFDFSRMNAVYDLHQRTGLPLDTVSRRFDEVSRMAGDVDFNPATFAKAYPATADWLTDPNNAGISKGDWSVLGRVEELLGRWRLTEQSGRRSFLSAAAAGAGAGGVPMGGPVVPEETEQGLLSREYRRGAAGLERVRIMGRIGARWAEDPATRARVEELRATEDAFTGGLPAPTSLFERALRSAAGSVVPSLTATFGAGAETGAGAALVAGALTAAAGQAGPQVVLPEEVVTVPTAMLTAGTVGFTVGSVRAAQEMMAGASLDALEQVRDEFGRPLSPLTKDVASQSVGILGAGAEFVGLRRFLQPFGQIGARALGLGMSKALVAPTSRAAVLAGVKEWGQTVGTEVATEVAQQAITLAGEELARAVSGAGAVGGERWIEELTATAVETALGMGIVAAPGAALTTADQLARVGEAHDAQAWMTALGESAEASALRARNPAKFREVVDAAIERGGAVRNVAVPVEEFVSYWQSQDIDPAQAAAEIGVTEAFEQAMVTNTDVVIPLADYVAKVAGTPHHEKLLPHLRLRPGAMTGKEADAAMATLEQDAEALREQLAGDLEVEEGGPAAQIVDDLTGMLTVAAESMPKATRYTPDQIATMATALAKPFVVAGEKSKRDPYLLWRSKAVKLLGPDRAEALFDVTRALQKAEQSGASAAEMGVLRQKVQKLADDRVTIRAALEIEEQVEPVRDEGGRLVPSLRKVSTDALVLEFIRLRDTAIESRAQVEAFESDPAYRSAVDMAQMGETEDAQGAYEDAGGAAAVWSFSERTRMLRQAKRKADTAERSLPRIEKELTARGVTDPDTYAAERELTGDATFAPDDFAQFQSRIDPMLERRALADEMHEMAADGLTAREIATETNMPLASVERTLAAPRPPLSPEERRFVDLTLSVAGPMLEQRPFENVPDSLMGFPKSGQSKPFAEQRYRLSVPVLVKWADGTEHADEVRGLNVSHALERARRNWPDAQSVEQNGEPGQAEVLEQAQGKQTQRPNAFILPGRAENVIGLLETANLSSVLHEFGHLYLDLYRGLASAPEASAEIQKESAAILKALGVSSWDAIGTKEHEYWARSFEKYLRTAEAPSADLRRAFARFKAWLTGIYAQVKAMLRPVSPELRDIFDRMLATEEEVAATLADTPPLIESAEQGKMTDAQFAAYQTARGDYLAASDAALFKRVLTESDPERREGWKERRAELEADLTDEVTHEPVQQLVTWLRADLPEGAAPVRLSKQLLIERYGKDIAKSLPKQTVTTEQGTDPDIIALAFGFPDADAMVTALQQWEPAPEIIQRRLDARLRAEFPDLMDDSSALADAAQKVVHAAAHDDVLVEELKALGRTDAAVPPPNLPAVKALAREVIDGTAVRDLQPHRYLTAERKANRLAKEALRKGETARAAFHGRQQLLNHILYRYATKAQEMEQTALRFFGRMGKPEMRKRLGLAGPDEQRGLYRDAMDGLLNDYEFVRLSNVALDRRARLAAWMDRMAADGLPVHVPDRLKADVAQRNYRTLSVGELQAVYDTGKQIHHIATNKRKFLEGTRKKELAVLEQEFRASVAAHHDLQPRTRDFVPKPFEAATDFFKKVDAWHVKPEFLFRWLDGDTDHGTVWQTLFLPISEAENDEGRRLRAAIPQIEAVFDRIPKALRKSWKEHRLTTANGTRLSGETIFAMGLNWGNEGNRTALLEGSVDGRTEFTPADISRALSTLTTAEWEAIQAAWDLVDSFWTDISQMEQRLVGVAPPKVQATPFLQQTADGDTIQMRGGYYPLKYDSNYSWNQRKAEAEQSVTQMGEWSYTRAQTAHGHTEARVGSGKKPVALNLSVLAEHVMNVIHDLSHREAVLRVGQLMERPSIRETIEQAAGRELYDTLNPWLKRVASDRLPPASPVESLLAKARRGVTTVSMGLKATTAVMQPLGYLNSIDHLGAKYARRGMQDFLRTPVTIWNFVADASEQMRGRRETFDRDLRDAAKQTDPMKRREAKVRRGFMFFTSMADMMVSVPTWYGGYLKSMEELAPGDHDKAVQYADQAVRLTQGSGSPKDLARIQGGAETQRMFTLFYSYFSVLYNQFRRRAGNIHSVADVPRFAASLALLWFIPSVLGELFAARGPEDDEDWSEWAAWEIARYPFGTVVGVRDVASALGPDGFDYDLSPVADVGRSLVAASKALGQEAGDLVSGNDDDELTASETHDILDAAGYWFALPTRQMTITGTALYDWMMGYDSPENPVDAVRDLAFRRRDQ